MIHQNVLSPEVLVSRPIQVLAAFVAVNTLIFVVLAIASLLPKVYLTNFTTNRNRRTETRSIFPKRPK